MVGGACDHRTQGGANCRRTQHTCGFSHKALRRHEGTEGLVSPTNHRRGGLVYDMGCGSTRGGDQSFLRGPLGGIPCDLHPGRRRRGCAGESGGVAIRFQKDVRPRVRRRGPGGDWAVGRRDQLPHHDHHHQYSSNRWDLRGEKQGMGEM